VSKKNNILPQKYYVDFERIKIYFDKITKTKLQLLFLIYYLICPIHILFVLHITQNKYLCQGLYLNKK